MVHKENGFPSASSWHTVAYVSIVYHPGRNYYKIIPWNNYFYNILWSFSSWLRSVFVNITKLIASKNIFVKRCFVIILAAMVVHWLLRCIMYIMFLDAPFWLTVGSFLCTTVEFSFLRLWSRACLLMIGADLLAIDAFVLAMGRRVKWAPQQTEQTQQTQQKRRSTASKIAPTVSKKSFPPITNWNAPSLNWEALNIHFANVHFCF